MDRRQFLLGSTAGLVVVALGVPARAAGPAAWDAASKPGTVTLSNSDLTASFGGASTYTVQRCDTPIQGKVVFEVTVVFGAGASQTNNFGVGIANDSMTATGYWLGQTGDSAGFFPGGQVYFNASGHWDTANFDGAPTTPTTVMIAVDVNAGKLWLYNGSTWGGDYSGSDNPATGTGGLAFSIAGDLYPACQFHDYQDAAIGNFGASSFVHSAQFATLAAAGFTTVDSQYPQGVVDQGLEDVWDLPSVVGIQNAPNKFLSSSSDRSTYLSGLNSFVFGADLYVTGNASFSQWDLSGYTVYVRGNSTVVTFTDCKFAANAVYLYNIGDNGTTPTVTMTNCEFDQSSTTVNHGDAKVSNGVLNLSYCYMHSASCDYLEAASDTNIDHCYFEAPGNNSGPNAHIETLRYFNGDHTLSSCFLDGRGGQSHTTPTVNGGMTGLVHLGPATGNTLSVTMTDTIMVGTSTLVCPYTMQGNADEAYFDLSVTNCVLESGSSGYFGVRDTNMRNPTIYGYDNENPAGGNAPL